MKNLLVFRENVRMIYSKWGYIIDPFMKFLLSFVSLTCINSTMGYMETINSIPIVLVVALLCSFMPLNTVIVMDAIFIILHAYALSMATLIVTLIAILLLFLLYFRFSPKDSLLAVLTPLLFLVKIPYVSPIAAGLLCGPTSAISVGMGSFIYYYLHYIKMNEVTLSSGGDDALLTQFRALIDSIVHNKEMFVTIVAFAIAVVLVYLIRRLSVDRSWTIAMIAGTIADFLILLMGDLIFGTDISVIGVVLGSVVALVIGKVIEFFCFNVDYNRTEYVQYEDDEYYYYVKAVPKNVIAKPEKSVKKVSSATKALPDGKTIEEARKAAKVSTAKSSVSTAKSSATATKTTTGRTLERTSAGGMTRTTASNTEKSMGNAVRRPVTTTTRTLQGSAPVKNSETLNRSRQPLTGANTSATHSAGTRMGTATKAESVKPMYVKQEKTGKELGKTNLTKEEQKK